MLSKYRYMYLLFVPVLSILSILSILTSDRADDNQRINEQRRLPLRSDQPRR